MLRKHLSVSSPLLIMSNVAGSQGVVGRVEQSEIGKVDKDKIM